MSISNFVCTCIMCENKFRATTPGMIDAQCPNCIQKMQQMLTDPIVFSGGTYMRRGEYMIVYAKNKYFEPKPIYEFLPLGFDYDMSTLTFIPTGDDMIKIQVRVDGWTNNVMLSELSNYKVAGQLTINTPGTYDINGQKIALHDGSISIELNNINVNADGTIRVPVKKV